MAGLRSLKQHSCPAYRWQQLQFPRGVHQLFRFATTWLFRFRDEDCGGDAISGRSMAQRSYFEVFGLSFDNLGLGCLAGNQVVGSFVLQLLSKLIPLPERLQRWKWTRAGTVNMLGHLLQLAAERFQLRRGCASTMDVSWTPIMDVSWTPTIGIPWFFLHRSGDILEQRPVLRQEGFITMSNIAFIPFSCFSHPSGAESLLTATNILCGSEDHRYMQAYGVILGLLCLAFLSLCSYAALKAPSWSEYPVSWLVGAGQLLQHRLRLTSQPDGVTIFHQATRLVAVAHHLSDQPDGVIDHSSSSGSRSSRSADDWFAGHHADLGADPGAIFTMERALGQRGRCSLQRLSADPWLEKL
eukprot:Skav208519  [mRNA]  locus=scaffold1322:209880:213355:- [translate_table: standard]